MRPPAHTTPTDWLTFGLLAMSCYVITLSAFVEGLSNNPLFRTLAQAIVITGLIGIALAYHYRSDQQKMAEIAQLQKENAALRKRLENRRNGRRAE